MKSAYLKSPTYTVDTKFSMTNKTKTSLENFEIIRRFSIFKSQVYAFLNLFKIVPQKVHFPARL